MSRRGRPSPDQRCRARRCRRPGGARGPPPSAPPEHPVKEGLRGLADARGVGAGLVRGARKYVAFADKCWPAFPSQFGFEPCFVNSRSVTRGILVACEVDVFGALSEYLGMCASADTVALLDINNSVPAQM